MFYLTLVIPCYNEEGRIEATFKAYFDFFQSNENFKNKKIAIVLVNDGSLDKTNSVISELENFSNEKTKVISVSYEQNQGKGAAIKQGCKLVDSKFYGFVDADLSFTPWSVEQAVVTLDNCSLDLVVGQRVKDNNTGIYSKIRSFVSRLLQRTVNFSLSMPNIDTQCGFKFFTKKIASDVLPKIKGDRFSFDVELIILARQNHYNIKNFPLDFKHDNRSTVTWRDGVRYFLDVVSISERLKLVEYKNIFLTLFFLAATISFIVYGWVMFKGYLFSDDFTWLWHGQKIGNSLNKILTFRMSTFYSPVMNAFYSLMYSAFGYSVQPLFFAGIVVHAIVSLFSGIFVWQLSKSRLIATTVTILVAFAGIAYEPLLWIGANMHSFVSLFILLCLICFYAYLSTQKFSYLIISFFSLIFALGTKESAIVTPLLLIVTLFYFKTENKKRLPKVHVFYWIAVIFVSSLYLFQQYLWQRNGVWVQTSVWNVTLVSLLRIPFIVLDNFIPMELFKATLSNWPAGLLFLAVITFFAITVYKFRKLKLFLYGFSWLLISISPFIFFKTEFWWEPLASRYNYLPRIGAIIIIAAILQYLIVQNKSRHVISTLIYFVIISVIAQLFVVGKAISTKYEYVYNTGRSLTHAMQKIATVHPDKVLVRWDHPFTENNAHIVGAASVIANLDESKIEFLGKNSEEKLGLKDVLVYWNPFKRQYEIKQRD